MFATGFFGLEDGNFDPTALHLTGFWREYSGTSFPAVESAGTSGDNGSLSQIDPGLQPGSGATVNGYTPADYDGADDVLNAGGGTADLFANSTTIVGWMLIKPDDVTTTVNIWSIPSDGSEASLVISSGSIYLVMHNGAGGVSRAITVSVWSLVTWRYNGTNIQIGVNEAPGASGGGSTAAYSTSMTLTGTMVVGNGGTGDYDGQVLEIATSDTNLADVDFTNVKNYVNARYSLSL